MSPGLIGTGKSGKVILLGDCFNLEKHSSTTKVIISEDIDANLLAVSRTKRLPVLLTEEIIAFESIGLILLRSINSQDILCSYKSSIILIASIVIYDILTIVISFPLLMTFALPIGIL